MLIVTPIDSSFGSPALCCRLAPLPSTQNLHQLRNSACNGKCESISALVGEYGCFAIFGALASISSSGSSGSHLSHNTSSPLLAWPSARPPPGSSARNPLLPIKGVVGLTGSPISGSTCATFPARQKADYWEVPSVPDWDSDRPESTSSEHISCLDDEVEYVHQ